MSTNFDAVILAGGKSSRMGRDKAFLEYRGQILLARQIALVREAGAHEVFISGRAGVDYSASGCPVVEDEIPEIGPLAGIARALDATREPLLLVLAVDMPNMTADFLKRLHGYCREGAGAVPTCGAISEPLVAFYPRASGKLIRELMAKWQPPNSPGAKHFAQACADAGLVCLVPAQSIERTLFKSWNVPSDLPTD